MGAAWCGHLNWPNGLIRESIRCERRLHNIGNQESFLTLRAFFCQKVASAQKLFLRGRAAKTRLRYTFLQVLSLLPEKTLFSSSQIFSEIPILVPCLNWRNQSRIYWFWSNENVTSSLRDRNSFTFSNITCRRDLSYSPPISSQSNCPGWPNG